MVKQLLILLLFGVAGCATDVANRYYGSTVYPPRPPSEVDLLTADPGRPYTVIADFQSRGDTAESLRKKAADIGADAIIVTELGGVVSPNAEWADQASYHRAYDHIVGTAIKYK